jgi:hypothetical protein
MEGTFIMNAIRTGLLVCAVAAVFGTAACGNDAAPAPYDALAAAPASTAPKASDVDAGIIDALTATSVTWTDGEVVKADNGPGYTIRRLTGASHRHTAPLATDVKLYLPFDAEGVAQLDKDNLGTVECTDPAKFKAHVLDNTRTAPRISVDANGTVVKMAARYAA